MCDRVAKRILLTTYATNEPQKPTFRFRRLANFLWVDTLHVLDTSPE